MTYSQIPRAGKMSVSVSMPDTIVNSHDTIEVPLFASSLSGLNIFSYETNIRFDTTVLHFVTLVKAGTLSNDASIISNRKADTVLIAASATSALSGRGELIRIRFAIDTNVVSGGYSPLEFTRFQFNEGSPPAFLTNGKVTFAQRITIQTQIHNGWNLLSLPLTVDDGKVSTLFGEGLNAFVYTPAGYVPTDSIRNGEGFWIKLSADSGITYKGITGTVRVADTIAVNEGWNLVGSISDGVERDSIKQLPDSILASDFFGFDVSYYQTNFIVPMRGYWLKANANGRLKLSSNQNAMRRQQVFSPNHSLNDTTR
ncbi:MAG: hypothetical protein HY960_01245 [Ignavibacteriae bacterium]|nr:hypothetical protein [Ignavibacteriota bacterium]